MLKNLFIDTSHHKDVLEKQPKPPNKKTSKFEYISKAERSESEVEKRANKADCTFSIPQKLKENHSIEFWSLGPQYDNINIWITPIEAFNIKEV